MLTQNLKLTSQQKLKMTPQLQQALRMLQLPTQELIQEIRSFPNVMIEEIESDIENPESQLSEEMVMEIAVDESHEDLLPLSLPAEENKMTSFIDRCQAPSGSLQAHLCWQLHFSHLSPQEYQIAEMIIDSINEQGFLETSLEDLHKNFKKQASFREIENMLTHIQTFDPPGVGARNLQECLLLQLNMLFPDHPSVKLAKKIIGKYLQLLGAHQHQKLCRLCGVSQCQLDDALALIKKLHPRPGNQISSDELTYVVPDIVVKKENNQWTVSLNPLSLPKFRLNNSYATLPNIKSDFASEKFMSHQLQEARWIMKCVQQRNDTLLKVAACIVQKQQAFLGQGAAAMKPLILKEIAEDVGLHPSTISRITTQKYIQTPRGVFELKYFFNASLQTSYGQNYSSTAVQAHIQNMIKEENARKPLSDEMISKKLLAKGIKVARRTVAKYREILSILPASKRRLMA